MLTACQVFADNPNLAKCLPLGLDLADWASIGGFVFAVSASLKFAIAPILRRIGLLSPQKIRSWRALRRALKPFAMDNHRLFVTFGPRSSADSNSPTEFDLAAWHQIRLQIVQNNKAIFEIIQSHKQLIPTEFASTFDEWMNHISAFEAHVKDPNVDYRNHQFPSRINEIL